LNIISFNKKILAIILITLSSLFEIMMFTILKIVQADINVYTTSFFRFFFSLIILTPYIFYSKFYFIKTPNLKKHIIRSSLNLPSMYLTFGALTMVPLEKINAIHFLNPLFVSIFAVIFFKEKIYNYRIISLVLGFIGIIIVIRPGMIQMEAGNFMVLGSTILWALVIIVTKDITKKDSAITILIYQCIFLSVFTLIIASFNWEMPSYNHLLLIFLSSLFGIIFNLMINHSFKLVDLTLTAPFRYSALIWGSLFGFLFFKEIPDIFTWIGGTIIFLSIMTLTYFESKNDQK
tara:strand:- start:94 stop:966 length:873 start_codon:yes stop_codon:yes gene_type:complete